MFVGLLSSSYISAITGCVATGFPTDIHGPQMMYHDDCGDPMTFSRLV